MALRRSAAVAAAVVLVVEAAGVVFLNLLLGLMVDDQSMSMAGADPRVMSVGAWVAGALFGAYLLICALLLLRVAIRDTGPRGLVRIVLISCAVVQGVLAAASLGLSGWGAFAFMAVSLALVVWTLIGYGDNRPQQQETSSEPPETSPEPPPAPAG